MAINIQNLLNAVNTKVQSLDSSSDNTEVIKLSKLAKNINATSGVLKYRSRGELPAADSAYLGLIVYVEDKVVDQYGSFYYGLADSWQKLTLTADSDEGDISFAPIPVFGGTTSGYIVYSTSIQKYSFVSDGNATVVGSTTNSITGSSGSTSSTHGYVVNGNSTKLEKWPFTSEGVSTVVQSSSSFSTGDEHAGVTDFTNGYGYTISWYNSNYTNLVGKYPHADDGSITDIADNTVESYGGTGQNSAENGYVSIGNTPVRRQIYKFPFAGNGSQTLYSGLQYDTQMRRAGTSSDTYGYNAGGTSPGYSSNIEKFSFATEADAALTGQLTVARGWGSGSSSTEYGYTNGGYNGPPTVARVTIDKFPFAADANATDVGDLANSAYYSGVGWQF